MLFWEPVLPGSGGNIQRSNRKINASDNFVVAVDVPSGVEASDGRVMERL